ncbi:MAG: 16S rRNA (guanine(527)-N(7))-methyltransferase RsmG [Chitinophagales bacterium]
MPDTGAGAASWEQLLVSGFEAVGVPVTPEAVGLLRKYMDLLRAENERANLTRILEPAAVAIKHFVDSATLLKVVELERGRLVDVGSGAGFPGAVIAVLRPEVGVTLVESNGKKSAFLKLLAEELGLRNVTVVGQRAEEVGRARGHRAQYDVATARAVAALPVIMEYLLPLVRVGGSAVALKGPEVEKEIEAGRKAARQLGGWWVRVEDIALPEGAGQRRLAVVRKDRPTPEQYPRRTGVPAKKPLGGGVADAGRSAAPPRAGSRENVADPAEGMPERGEK